MPSKTQPMTVVKPLSTTEEFIEKQEISKAERFHKIAGGRIATALRAIELIGNCADTSRYEYTPSQIELVFAQLRETLRDTEAKFQPKKRDRFGRNFFQGR